MIVHWICALLSGCHGANATVNANVNDAGIGDADDRNRDDVVVQCCKSRQMGDIVDEKRCLLFVATIMHHEMVDTLKSMGISI